MPKDTLGVDVSKDCLDAFWYSKDEARNFLNTEEGFEQLCAWLGESGDVLIDMPELGHLDAKKIAALAGLAPMTQQSVKWQGKERIVGGRASFRRAIYMPALVAIRFNHDFKASYQRLLKAGKAKKVAITAVMRRIVVLANTLLREGRDWQLVRP